MMAHRGYAKRGADERAIDMCERNFRSKMLVVEMGKYLVIEFES